MWNGESSDFFQYIPWHRSAFHVRPELWHMRGWMLIHTADVTASSAANITYELHSSSNTNSGVPLIQFLSDSNQIARSSGLWSYDNFSWKHFKTVPQFSSSFSWNLLQCSSCNSSWPVFAPQPPQFKPNMA